MKIFSLFIFLIISLSLYAQKNTTSTKENRVNRTYYYDKEVCLEYWYGDDKIIDSIKTYYPNGLKNEQFYFDKGKMHGTCYQYNLKGEKIVKWNFNQNKLIDRTDHKIEFHENNEEIILKAHAKLEKATLELKENPNNMGQFYSQTYARYILGNTTLALYGFKRIERYLEKSKENNKPIPPKLEAGIYDCLGAIFSQYEQENKAIHYRYLAIKTAPDQSRLYYNFGAYLTSIKAYRLAQVYLNKALDFSAKHSFANWGLANVYTDLGDYEKAMSCIEIAFKGQESIHKLNLGNAGRDLHTTRGYLHHKLGNTAEGISDLKKAIELNPTNSFAMRYLGEIYYDLEQYNVSCEYLQKAKELGYEKTYDRNDLEYFLSYSCFNKTIDKVSNLSQLPYAYPNPIIDKVTIQNIEEENFSYQLFNYNNRIVLVGIADHKSIDISKLSAGLYILTFKIDEKEYSLKIIKE